MSAGVGLSEADGRGADGKNLELKIYLYEAVVRVHDASNLNEPAVVEPALRLPAVFIGRSDERPCAAVCRGSGDAKGSGAYQGCGGAEAASASRR